ncbi:NAD(P)H-hydrate dehydratase [Natronospira bacteriovora]|uniref:Bifunctional NAD(P)H-hydrate repair enzyme n=1 Tax=Natronospira bacteriovora TaxID=3069753 RepID=A0ABU0W5W8_9GAMM|nr:NAD(P)H-hydrate dehydratase [Natronospira sp. AB-CW4]MDQ2069396.1 NAD(P)H-hydrate dehydratase [Natronospira sp. AB-CW4]
METIPQQGLYTVEQVRELDRRAISAEGIDGYALMCRAGEAAFRRLRFFWPGGSGRLLVLTGPGNNGGDGYVIARLAREAGLPVTLMSAVDGEALRGDAARARADWLACGGEEGVFEGALPADAGLIVDALLGTGLSRPPEGRIAEFISLANAHPAPVFAVDCPSGLDADKGTIPGDCIRAAHTATFIGQKRGLFTARARAVTGRVHFERLGVADAVYQGMNPAAFLIDRRQVSRNLPDRAPTAHKGLHGHVAIVGGDHGMGGATIMAAEAALRGGAGRVSLLTRPSHVAAALTRLPEVLVRGVRRSGQARAVLAAADVVVIGPGLGQARWGRRLLAEALASGRPLVVDADGLNLLASESPVLPAACVLTPHPGEAGRLLGLSVPDLEQDRFDAMERLLARFDTAVVLKGAGTLVGAPDWPIHVCDAGNGGMAVAGMGDVLAGLIGALMAQGLPAREAATAGVWLHAAAGDLAVREQGPRGLRPTDLFPAILRLSNPPEARQ